jgi:hypothetical protein
MGGVSDVVEFGRLIIEIRLMLFFSPKHAIHSFHFGDMVKSCGLRITRLP